MVVFCFFFPFYILPISTGTVFYPHVETELMCYTPRRKKREKNGDTTTSTVDRSGARKLVYSLTHFAHSVIQVIRCTYLFSVQFVCAVSVGAFFALQGLVLPPCLETLAVSVFLTPLRKTPDIHSLIKAQDLDTYAYSLTCCMRRSIPLSHMSA